MGKNQSKMQSSSRKSEDENSFEDDKINRLAIDPSGRIGSFYDARSDQLLANRVMKITHKSILQDKSIQVPKVEVGTLHDKSLSDIIGINKDLCLSICLKLANLDGAPSAIRYSVMSDSCTRYISYYYVTKQVQGDLEKNSLERKDLHELTHGVNATHIVADISYGIHVFIILQLSSSDQPMFDQLLENVKSDLSKKRFDVAKYDMSLFKNITHLNVFSHIKDITSLTSLPDICQKLNEIQANSNDLPAIQYSFRSIRWLCSSYSNNEYIFIPLNPEYVDYLLSYCHELLLARNRWKLVLCSEDKHLLMTHLKKPYEKILMRDQRLETEYNTTQSKMKDLVLDIRNNHLLKESLNELLAYTREKTLLENMNQFTEDLTNLIQKERIIEDLNTEQIEYQNIQELITEESNDLEATIKQIRNKNQQKVVYCFDDRLSKLESPEWKKLFDDLKNYHRNSPGSAFMYADFSYCSFQLKKMEILLSHEDNQIQNHTNNESSLNPTAGPMQIGLTNKSNRSSNDVVNVLILGESGVGKSTFINALVNYLKFDSLKTARCGDLAVLIPVSFLMTTGDNFEEKIVRFGGKDINEDFDHPGQSVTQQCKSYIFTVGTRTRLRLIDTPGMGDTRGLEQDDRNMQHILSFVNNLSHLNAICILLKPNESKLSVVFRSYFGRLTGFLGENSRNNIIFCFTNTRTTFFTPGDTAPLLKEELKKNRVKDIPFTKQNTFCFDSESFRYLIACQNNIEFDQYQKDEYKESWKVSVKETERLIGYICQELKTYSRKEWQSIEHADFQIKRMIRPMLETLKNIMRNMILSEQNSSKSIIRLQPKVIERPLHFCMECDRSLTACGAFWVINYRSQPHTDRCNRCQNNFSTNPEVNYALEYKLSRDKDISSSNDMKKNFQELRKIIIDFGCFYKYIMKIVYGHDPIVLFLSEMIDDEKYILSQKGEDILNKSLYKKLKDFQQEYKRFWSMPEPNKQLLTLEIIYQRIQDICQINDINQQLLIIQQIESMHMKENEKQV